jgi:hypothetical protein
MRVAVEVLAVLLVFVTACGDDTSGSDVADVVAEGRDGDGRSDSRADADGDADAAADADARPTGTCVPDPVPRRMEFACYPTSCCGFPHAVCYTQISITTTHDGCGTQFLGDDGVYYYVECGDATPYPSLCVCHSHVAPSTDECADAGGDVDADAEVDAADDAGDGSAGDGDDEEAGEAGSDSGVD